MGIIWVFVSTEVGGMLDEVLDQSEIDDDKCTAEGRWLRMPVFGTFCALVSGVETMLQGGFLLHLSHDPSVRGEVSICDLLPNSFLWRQIFFPLHKNTAPFSCAVVLRTRWTTVRSTSISKDTVFCNDLDLLSIIPSSTKLTICKLTAVVEAAKLELFLAVDIASILNAIGFCLISWPGQPTFCSTKTFAFRILKVQKLCRIMRPAKVEALVFVIDIVT